MKEFFIGTAFILWMLITMILAFSIVGWVLFVPDGSDKSTWMKLGVNLFNELKK